MRARKGAGPGSVATDLEARKNVGSGNARSFKPQPQNPQAAPKSWRDVLPIHPAADLFPLMPEAELKALAQDDADGNPVLLDGRNRLDALSLLGEEITLDNEFIFERVPGDIDGGIHRVGQYSSPPPHRRAEA